MKTELKVDGLTARPGEKVKGFVLFDESAAGIQVQAPVFVINGAHEGPTLVVTSGVHGDDLNTIPMTWRIAEQIDAGQLRGQVIAIPVVNPLALPLLIMIPPRFRAMHTARSRSVLAITCITKLWSRRTT